MRTRVERGPQQQHYVSECKRMRLGQNEEYMSAYNVDAHKKDDNDAEEYRKQRKDCRGRPPFRLVLHSLEES